MGITQEQHPARCRLLARWKGIDAPILWDPFNLTGSKVVPSFTLVDEHGVVRYARAKVSDLPTFLGTTYEAPEGMPATPSSEAGRLVDAHGLPAPVGAAMSRALWHRDEDPSSLIDALRNAGGSEDPVRTFQRGVAYRMRADSPFAQPGDLAAAFDAWRKALEARPDQYIWRRRLQQYGPMTDKPYPFYGWIEEAQAALASWGEAPEPLDAALTLSERGLGTTGGKATVVTTAPDPKAALPLDETDALWVESAVVFDTTSQEPSAQLHVSVRPTDERRTTWHGGTDPLVLWLELPAGWTAVPQGLARPLSEGAKGETYRFEVALKGADASSATTLRGYVLAPVCRAAEGVCVYIRKDLTLELRR